MWPFKRRTQHVLPGLREARERRGWSQEELSRRSGVSQATISRIENGKVDVRTSTLVKLSDVLGVVLTYTVSGKGARLS